MLRTTIVCLCILAALEGLSARWGWAQAQGVEKTYIVRGKKVKTTIHRYKEMQSGSSHKTISTGSQDDPSYQRPEKNGYSRKPSKEHKGPVNPNKSGGSQHRIDED